MRGATSYFAAFGILATLAGCGTVDSGATYFPESMRVKAPKPAAAEPAPDVRALLQANLSAVFVPQSAPTNISFSAPKPSFAEWITCVKASVNGATGRPIGSQTYLVNIDHGQVSRRERVDAGHWCATERYSPL
jgi:predicted small lipoprotein YifL